MKRRSLTPKETEALQHVRNRIVHGGESPSVRELRDALGYRSPNAAAYILQRLIDAGYLRRRDDGKLQLLRDPSKDTDPSHARTVQVPLVGTVPCGTPLLAEQNVEAMIPVSIRLARPPHRYFLLRAQGDSMDRAGINDGDLLLVRQQPTADPGQTVIALIDDHATVKRLRRTDEAIVLEPQSTNPAHKPIILDSDFQVQGIVITTVSSQDSSL